MNRYCVNQLLFQKINVSKRNKANLLAFGGHCKENAP